MSSKGPCVPGCVCIIDKGIVLGGKDVELMPSVSLAQPEPTVNGDEVVGSANKSCEHMAMQVRGIMP